MVNKNIKTIEKNNHLYPMFHIRKWIDCHGKVFDKELNKKDKQREIIYKKDFVKRLYYSLGRVDNTLEHRLSVFECEIAPLIERIDLSNNNVHLSGKELELLKLYCLLCVSRHNNACEVIKNDELGIYKSNDYLIGVHRNETQKEAVDITTIIVDEFERIKGIPNDDSLYIGNKNDFDFKPLSSLMIGLHLVIVQSQEPVLLISDRLCIIENTMDSDFLYTYVPISPRTALLLVKSKYYYNEETFLNAKQRFGNKYGNGRPDEYLSDIFGAEVGDYEDRLFCEYYTNESLEKLVEKETDSLYIKIQQLPKEVFRLFNSIYCEDGNKILFCDKEELDYALNHQLLCRDILIE